MTDSKTPQVSDALAVFTHTGNAPVRFELHDKGVVSQQGDTRSYTAFADVLDLCLFPAEAGATAGPINQFAYRTSTTQDWTVVSGDVSNFAQLLDAFRSRYVAQRLPVLEALMADGKRVAFRTIKSGDFPGFDTQELALSAEGLHIDGATWPYESLQRIDLNDWTETITLQDDNGKTVFSCVTTRILSSDLLVNLVYDQLGQTAEYA
ncbi:hypothetical protein ACFY89_22360 [Achromobacter spanius]|uniref:hypothetical protein n=1 Tax=Achromobacter spanius TaxID=217203 RepID=UPI0036E6BD2E